MKENSELLIEFTLIYNRYKSGLYYYVLKMLNEKMVAEDILQNVFMKLYKNLPLIENKESISSWLYTTARNEIYEHLRRKKSKPVFYLEDDFDVRDENNLESLIDNKEIQKTIEIEIEKIPVEQKEVFLLKEYSQLSYKEISAIQNIDEELVKSRLFKARKKLITRLSKILNENKNEL